MKKIFIIYILVYNCFAYSQQSTKKYTVLKSTITSVGSSTIYNHKGKYSIQQSVGQSGIIGKKEVNSITVQQGFLTSNINLNIDNSTKDNLTETLDFVISPNPFIDHIKIGFSKKTTYDIYIRIYDVNGKVYSVTKHDPSIKIVLPMKRYSIGTYLIQIKSGKKNVTKKILKTNN